MADGFTLEAATPCAGMLPLKIGRLEAVEAPYAPKVLLMPYEGQDGSLSAALEQSCNVTLPGPGDSTTAGDVMALWFGRGQVLLIGTKFEAGWADYAAISDQSDAWADVLVRGAGVEDMLARLVPLDLRIKAFPVGATARTVIGHMSGSVTRVGAEAFRLMVFRSMAQTLVHEVKEAMETVAARA